MKGKLKKAFFAAMLGSGIIFGGSGAYIAGNAAVREYVTQKVDFNQGKSCIKQVIQGGADCSTEDYRRAALYADNKKDYAFGLSWLFGGSSFVRMSLPRVRKSRKNENNGKPNTP